MVEADDGERRARAKHLYLRTNAQLERRRLAEAKATARELVRLLAEVPDAPASDDPMEPTYGTALSILGLIEYLDGNTEEAEQLHSQAIDRLRPDGGLALGRALVALTTMHMDLGRESEARGALREATDALLLPEDPLDSGSLDLLGAIASRARRLGDLELAQSALEGSVRQYERDPATPGDPAGIYQALMGIHVARGAFAEAVEPARRSLDVARSSGRGRRDLSVALFNLARILAYAGGSDEIDTLLEEAVDLAGDSAETRYYAADIRSVGLLKAGESGAAIAAMQEAVAQGVEAFGDYAQQTLDMAQRLADQLTSARRYAEALPYWQTLVAVERARGGPDSLALADRLGSLGLSLDQVGEASDAERAYREALAIRRGKLGERHPDTLVLLFNLAELARAYGDAESADRQFRDLEARFGSERAESDLRARALTNHGLALIYLERHEEAELKLRAALDLRGRLQGEESPVYGRILLALGQLEKDQERYEEAIAHLGHAARTLEGHPRWARTLEHVRYELACCRMLLERTDEAIDRAFTVTRAQTEAREPHHPGVGQLWSSLAVAALRAKAFSRAREALEAAETSNTMALVHLLESKPLGELRRTLGPFRDRQTVYLSVLLWENERPQGRIDRAYELLQQVRGAETTILRLRGRRYLQSDPSGVQSEIEALRAAMLQLQLGARPVGGAQHREADLERYDRDVAAAESKLASRVGQTRLDLEFMTPQAPRVKEGHAIVEFAEYVRLDPDADNPLSGEQSYAAFVLRAEDPIALVDLGLASEIDPSIERFRDAVVNQPYRRMERQETEWLAPGTELVARLIDPLRPRLEGVHAVTIVPEGRLGLLPFGSLPLPGHRYLIDEFEVTYRLASRRAGDVHFEEDLGCGGEAIVAGAPAYDLTGRAPPPDPVVDDALLSEFRSAGRFEPLPDSEGECTDIAELLEVQPLIAERAEEGALRSLESPEVLHISTHGFFLPRDVPADQAPVAAGAGASRRRRDSLADSLDRCGLAFAGANAYLDRDSLPSNAHDGVLYASEVAGLNLTRTDLVTLSACQTGVGDVRRGDGVHGLQRAFLTAGARTVVCSLWEVPDKTTRALFTSFYRHLLDPDHRPIGEALQSAIRELIVKYPAHPIAWGGFVLYGQTDVLCRYDPIRGLTVASMTIPPSPADPATLGPAQLVGHFIDRAAEQWAGDHDDEAIETLTQAIEVRGAPRSARARALYRRAGYHASLGDYEKALEDYDALDGIPELAEGDRVTHALGRSTVLMRQGRREDALAVYRAILSWDGLDTDKRAEVLVNSGALGIELGRREEAMEFLDAVIGMPGMPPEQRAKALVFEAEHALIHGDLATAESHAREVIDGVGSPSSERAPALLLLSRALVGQGRIPDAIGRLKELLALDGVPSHVRAMAEGDLEGLGG